MAKCEKVIYFITFIQYEILITKSFVMQKWSSYINYKGVADVLLDTDLPTHPSPPPTAPVKVIFSSTLTKRYTIGYIYLILTESGF